MPLLLSLTTPANAQTYRELNVLVADADEGEDIELRLELNSAPGNVSAAERTFTVSTAVPSTADVNSCISISGERACANGSTPASASDFTATSTSVVFGTNETQKTVSIPTTLDTVSEGVEVVRINIDYNPGTSDLGIFSAGNSSYTGRTRFVSSPTETATRLQINTYGAIDNEVALSISAPADASEGDSGTRDLVFTVTQSETTANTTDFRVCFTGTATADTATTGAIADAADYRPGVTFEAFWIPAANGCVTERINSNQTGASNPVTIRVKGDTDAESDETVIATLSVDGTGVTVLTSEATHTILDDDTPAPEISVAPDWALTPSGLTAGNKFRLLFVTSTERNAAATDIATYNTFVQNRAAAGHADIQAHSAQFTVVGSTSLVDARDNTSTTGAGEPIHWLNGDKVADNYADFYDGSWDSYAKRNESGATMGAEQIWTGSNDNGTKHTDYLGHTNVHAGQLAASNDPFTWASGTRATTRNFYGLSPVFTVAAATAAPEVSVRLMTGEGENRNADGEVEKSEVDAMVSFPLSLDTAPAAALTVCVRVAESGDTDRVTSANEGIKTVSFLTGVQTGSIDVAWTDTGVDDLDSVITVTAVPSSTAGCSSSDEYTVSSTQGAEKVRITDDEVTTVSLASSDMEMGEGDAANTAVMTVSLGRALISGESVAAPITLATTTGARLPDNATPDFGVTATGTGVALGNQTTVAPTLTFTGSDSNTVQTATVTLTPVANLDDGDATHESITATLTLLTGMGSGTVVTGGGVEVVQASSMVTLSIEDDEAAPPACSAQDGIFSESNLDRILENGGVATYCVRLTTAPSGGDTIVTLGRDGGNRFAANFSPATLTFTSSDYMTPQQVTVTGADEPNTHRNRPDMRVTHEANGGGYSSQNLGNVRVEVDDAPELEAWPDYDRANGSVPFLRRPNTVVSSDGLTPHRNMYPGYELTYVLRLSNRPEPGGTVTVTATVQSDKQNLIGLSLTGPSDPLDGPAYQNWATNLPGTLEVTFHDGSPGEGTGCSNWHGGSEFEYHDSNGRWRTVTGGRRSETWDNTADTPWECWRKVWVVRKDDWRNNTPNTCADITHTATGGGVRQVTVDTVRVHLFYGTDFTRARDCPKLTGNTLPPQGSPAEASPAPTDPVTNLQVTAVDDASASVAWDAVPHATSYDVSWSAESSDSLNASAGALPGVTGTSATIQHDASVAMTLTVTVTPEYVDEHGQTRQLPSLAGTATLDVGPQGGNLGGDGGTDGDGSDDDGPVDSGEGEVDLPSPVAHWTFDGDADDAAGSSDGTATGGAAFAANGEGEGVGSHALALDGVDDHVDLGSHASNFPLGDAARTVTGWFHADAGAQDQSFFAYGPNVAGQRFSIAADRTQVVVGVSGHAWGTKGLSLADGWHHVAVSYAGGDSDQISIYLDGALQSASTQAGSPQGLDTRSGPAAIGRNVRGTKHYAGLIEDVRLYDIALSAEQVQAIANREESAQAAATTPGLGAPTSPSASGLGAPTSPSASGLGAPTSPSASAGGPVHVPLLPGSSNPLREGLVRIVNRSAQAGEVRIVAVDDTGWRSAPVTLSLGAGESAQFTARDLEWGNGALGLTGATGPGTGDWRLEIASDLELDVLPWVRSHDGALHTMGEVAPVDDDVHRVALFAPADSLDATGKLRLTNRGGRTLRAEITGIDDAGASPGGTVSVELAAGASVLLTAAELEASGANLRGGLARSLRNADGDVGAPSPDADGDVGAPSGSDVGAPGGASVHPGGRDLPRLGDGQGQWRLRIASDGDLAVMNLIETSDGRLANLSGVTATAVSARKAHVVARFPSTAEASVERGVVRIVNSSGDRASIRIEPHDSTGWRYPPLTLTLGAGEAANLGAWDLEQGNRSKGLAGSTGPGTGGPWRLEVISDSDIEVLAFSRSADGLRGPLPGGAATESGVR